MISDKDIIVELLRQREELREAASNNSEDHKVVNQLHATISALKKDNLEWRKTVDDLRQEVHDLKASYEVKQVEKIIAERDELKAKSDDAENMRLHTCKLLEELRERYGSLQKENTRIYDEIEAALEERDAWKIRHDDMKKRSIELRSKYDELAARAWPTTK